MSITPTSTSGFFVAYPAGKEGFDHCTYRTGVLALAACLAERPELLQDVLFSCRVAAANCISEADSDTYSDIRLHLERYTPVVQICGDLVSGDLSGSEPAHSGKLINWLVGHNVSGGEA